MYRGGRVGAGASEDAVEQQNEKMIGGLQSKINNLKSVRVLHKQPKTCHLYSVRAGDARARLSLTRRVSQRRSLDASVRRPGAAVLSAVLEFRQVELPGAILRVSADVRIVAADHDSDRERGAGPEPGSRPDAELDGRQRQPDRLHARKDAGASQKALQRTTLGLSEP
jgi:hypothetical protein